MVRSSLLVLMMLVGPLHAAAADSAVRREIPLDGPWALSGVAKAPVPFSLEQAMADGAWQRDADTRDWTTINLPTLAGFYTPDSDAVPEGTQRFESYWFGRSGGPTYNAAWYRRSFDAPALAKDQRLFVKFMAVGAEAHVWVNGRKVGDHFGAFTGFEFDITDAVESTGNNTIAVYATTDFGERPIRRVYGKMFFSHQNAGGIIGPVMLEVRPQVAVKRALVTPRVEDGLIEIDYVIDNRAQERRPLEVRAHVQDRSVELGRLQAEPGVSEHSAIVQIDDPILWSPQTPHLYDLVVTLHEGDRVVDQVNERFGMRTFVAGDGKFFLNGVRTRLYFGNILTFGQFRYHEPAERARFRQWLERQKAQGVNTIRYHMGGTDSYLMLRVCDEVGMLVINEWPWFHRVESGIADPAARQQFFRTNDYEMEQWLYRDYNSPSNIMWSLSNEVWTKGEVPLLNHTYDHMRPLDRSGRPMSVDSGFHSVIRELPVKTDVYDLHNYTMHSTYPWSLVCEGVELDFKAIEKIYGQVDKPVIISESLNVPKSSKRLGAAMTPEVYLEHAGLPGVREIGLAAAADPQRGYRYLLETFGVRTLEQFRQDPRIQGFSPWFGDRNHLPDGIRHVYGPYYVGFRDLQSNLNPGGQWQGKIHVARDPLQAQTLRARLAVMDGSDEMVHEQQWPVELATGQETVDIPCGWAVPSGLPDGTYQARLELLDGQAVVAQRRTTLRVLSDAPPDRATSALPSVSVYDPAGNSVLMPLLAELGVETRSLERLDSLDGFEVLILAPGWGPELAPSGVAVAQWIRSGGRLVAFETDKTVEVPWAPGVKIIAGAAMRQPFVDLVVEDHALFDGLQRQHFDGWNGNHRLLTTALIAPLSLNTVAAAGSYAGEGQLAAITEAGLGKGRFLMTQLRAVERYESDPVARRFVQNVLQYAVSEAPGPVPLLVETATSRLLESLRSVDANACVPVDLRSVANAGTHGTVGESSALDLRHLPVGRQTFQGIPFELVEPASNAGKAILLMQGHRTPDQPQRVAITIDRRAQRLFFLHSAYYATSDVMARYILHYTDETSVQVPVDGKAVGDWFRPADREQAVVAWAAAHPVLQSAVVGCYLHPWRNPHPEKTISRIEVVSEGSEQQAGGSVMLLGVTLEAPGQ